MMKKESVVIIGGGIIGLACAYEAAKRNYQVTIIERVNFGGQASGAAAGMLAPYSELTEQPDEFFQLCTSSLHMYAAWVDEIEREAGQSVEYRKTGSLYVCQHEADIQPLMTRSLWQNQYGAAAELLTGAELQHLEAGLTDGVVAGIYTAKEGHVHAPRLVDALMHCCHKIGVTMLDHVGDIVDINIGEQGVQVTSLRGDTVSADRLIVSAGAWSGQLEKWLSIRLPIHPIRGQICAYNNEAVPLHHVIFSSQAYWVTKNDGRLICGASEDVAGFTVEVTERGINRLIRSSERWIPALRQQNIISKWAGLRPATRDGFPFIGKVDAAGQVIMAAGHYRNGILLSPITAKLVADCLDHKPDVMEQLSTFHPLRFT
ncbi:glycine oxidase ThiO [Paenibacillus yanchengensis]|uniref:glycine oxidase n=1 Tax=Paenibacillus yanchengensis TaxID=2035833 RepID=A0ABW4YNP6_9BACL